MSSNASMLTLAVAMLILTGGWGACERWLGAV